MSERKREIRNLILKSQNIPLNDLQPLMVVNEIQTKVMRVRNDTFINPIMESFYNVKNGSSFITSKSWSKNLSNENKHWHFCCLQDKT